MQNIAEQLLRELQARLPDLGAIPTPNVKEALAQALNKLDLVGREEFDAQAAVLARTRQRLEALEERVAQLEKL